MSDTHTKSVRFAFCLCLACSLLLTAAASGLKSRQDANVLLDKQKNILLAAGLLATDHKASRTEIQETFKARMRHVLTDQAGLVKKDTAETATDLSFYVKTDAGGTHAEGYVVPLVSKGLWGKIFGYVALESDGVTIGGFTVYSHQETPGLGGEIETPAFQQNFIGKKITDAKGDFAGVAVAKGKAADVVAEESLPNYVDGISGATLTGNFLSGGLQEVLKSFEPVADRFRSGEADAFLKTPESKEDAA